MIDLGFKGCKYTWTNKRYRNRSNLIFERLDRCSDHCPMLIALDHSNSKKGTKPFIMEPMWCGHPSFQPLVQHCFDNQDTLNGAINLFQKEATIWNSSTFGNIFKNTRKILARLDGIQRSPSYPLSHFLHDLESSLLQDYDNLLAVEKEFWKTKSRINWLIEGDANTSFFHTSTINRRRRNRITFIKDGVGNLLKDQDQLNTHIANFFRKLYTTNH
ncbi:hypothetical protein R3W88_029268 [Solanum pinnatisectum]|uniref:Uncharacterized protein n=1 Tax=Solanum pinnatisectum TaxID=50273 RepID=A0AAV9K5X6_9SOLN|nr:hypothetical protein R3W88_029268 [Solanum pinnatisectum]